MNRTPKSGLAPTTLFVTILLALLLGACTIQVGPRPLVTTQGVPLVADACKNDGWRTLRNDAGGSFKNQGDCVSYTNSR